MQQPRHWIAGEPRLKLLILAPYLDDRDVGEAHVAYRWVQALSAHADVTLLSMTRPEWSDPSDCLPHVRSFTLPEPKWARRMSRVNAMAKLSYASYARWARQTIQTLLKEGETFDAAHQLSPFAMRHTSPLRFFDIPYVLGPKAGSLETPEPLVGDGGADPFYMRMRALDRLRFRFSPALRDTYRRAALVMGVAPYVAERLGPLASDRFDIESELGVSALPPLPNRFEAATKGAPVRLLHIGRGVRSKGLRDAVRALALLPRSLHVHLDVAGQGPEIQACQDLAADLGVVERVTFHGQISRDAVDRLYAQADIFLFPSFREPSGSVVYEAMSFGLPIIGARAGGPGHVITRRTGILVDPAHPEAFARALAAAVTRLASDPLLRATMGEVARRIIEQDALWDAKARRMLKRYKQLLNPERTRTKSDNEKAEEKSNETQSYA